MGQNMSSWEEIKYSNAFVFAHKGFLSPLRNFPNTKFLEGTQAFCKQMQFLGGTQKH